MKDDFFIIYEGDEDDASASSSSDRTAKDPSAETREEPAYAKEGRERRRLKKQAARNERIQAQEAKRKAREAEYARQVAEYEQRKAQRARERDGKGTSGGGKADRSDRCKTAIILTLVGLFIVVVGLILFAVWYPAAWYEASGGNGRTVATTVVLIAGLVVMFIGNLLAIPSARAARSD